MTITPSRLTAALSYILDPTEVEIPMADMLDIGREIWRVSQGSRYELWSDFARARGIAGPLAEAKWRTYLVEPDGPDVIERLARGQGWDGGFDRDPATDTGTDTDGGDLWGDMVLGTCSDYATEHVISPPRSPIGIAELDAELGGGLASGTYTAIGGEGGSGKTALGVVAAYSAIVAGDFQPVIYSLEVTSTEVMDRLLAVHSRVAGLEPVWWARARDEVAARGVDPKAAWSLDDRSREGLVAGYLSEHGDDPVIAAWRDMQSRYAGRYAIRTTVSGVDDVCAEVDALVAEGLRPLPVIDHIHVLDPPVGTKADSEYERVTAVSHALMACAKRNRIPMLALAEIRNVGEKERDNPRLNWFRGSGHVGYDAGCAVILTHDSRPNASDSSRLLRANVVKNRHGRSGRSVPLEFIGGANVFK